MTGKGSSRQERAKRGRQTRNTDKAVVNIDANLRPHDGDDDSEDEEPSLSFVVKLIESFQKESHASIGNLQSTIDSYATRLTDVESSLQDGRVTELKAKCEALCKSNRLLMSKGEDMESRSRRFNLRVLGIPENTEGPLVTSFMSNFFAELLGIDNSGAFPLLDIAHRSLAPKPKPGAPSHPVIVKVHHFQVKQRILQLAREKALLMFR